MGCIERKTVAATTISCPKCDTEMVIPNFIIDEVTVCCPECGRKFSTDVSLEEKVAKLRMEAEGGNAEAQHDLGIAYLKGEGVDRDEGMAVEWLAKASQSGNAEASYSLAEIYEEQEQWENAVQEYGKAVSANEQETAGAAMAALGFLLLRLKDQNISVTIPKHIEDDFADSMGCGLFLLEEAASWPTGYRGDAANYLAFCYETGCGIEKSAEQAEKWREKAWWGSPKAPYKIAKAYEGIGGRLADFGKSAIRFYRIAAEMGYAVAQCELGFAYEDGINVQENPTEAFRWYLEAANQNDASAQCALGSCFCFGYGVEQNAAEAARWYRKAAENGDTQAQNSLGDCFFKGEGCDQDREEAVKWYRKAAGQGESAAQYSLGMCYLNGHGVPQDKEEAAQWLMKAAEQNEVGAMLNLGLCYKTGSGVLQDYAEAIKWFRKVEYVEGASFRKRASAEYELGRCSQLGLGCEKSFSDAARWYREAAKHSNPQAMFMLGEIYRKGEGVNKNDVEAAKYYKEAAKWNHPEGRYRYAVCLLNGQGVAKNEAEAVKLLRIAAAQGNKEAQLDLEYCRRHGIGVETPAGGTKGLGQHSGNPPNIKAPPTPMVVLPKPSNPLPTIRLPKPPSLAPKAPPQSSRPQVIKNPTEAQKDELANIISEVLGESGIEGASFGEDDENPFAFYVSIPGDGDERLVVYACNKLFHRLGLLPQDKGLMIGQLGDYCSIVSGGDGNDKCYVAALNHPVVTGLKENAPQARFILKNWRDWDGEE